MRISLASAALALALTACGSGGGADNVQTGPRPLDAVQNQVQALPEAQLGGVLLRAIRDARQECQFVESAVAQPAAADGSPVYLARCSGGQAYAVGIGRGGNASVQPAGGQ
jgi:hypothetical protein